MSMSKTVFDLPHETHHSGISDWNVVPEERKFKVRHSPPSWAADHRDAARQTYFEKEIYLQISQIELKGHERAEISQAINASLIAEEAPDLSRSDFEMQSVAQLSPPKIERAFGLIGIGICVIFSFISAVDGDVLRFLLFLTIGIAIYATVERIKGSFNAKV